MGDFMNFYYFLPVFLMVFISCGKDSAGDMSSSQSIALTNQDCSIGSNCNGGTYIGNYLNKKIYATLGSCSYPDPIACIGIANTDTEFKAHCENMVFGGYSDWTVALAEEVKLSFDNKIPFDNLISSYRYIGGGISPGSANNADGTSVPMFAPLVSGFRVLCARRISL